MPLREAQLEPIAELLKKLKKKRRNRKKRKPQTAESSREKGTNASEEENDT